MAARDQSLPECGRFALFASTIVSRRSSSWLCDGEASGFTARLTIDVTPDLRARVRIAAFRRAQTVADMLRDLLAREFTTIEGDPS